MKFNKFFNKDFVKSIFKKFKEKIEDQPIQYTPNYYAPLILVTSIATSIQFFYNLKIFKYDNEYLGMAAQKLQRSFPEDFLVLYGVILEGLWIDLIFNDDNILKALIKRLNSDDSKTQGICLSSIELLSRYGNYILFIL